MAQDGHRRTKGRTSSSSSAPSPPPPPPPPPPPHHAPPPPPGGGERRSAGVVVVGIPTIREWTLNVSDSTISGKIYGSSVFPDGSPVTTSPIVVDPKRSARVGCIVRTTRGSRYLLGDAAAAVVPGKGDSSKDDDARGGGGGEHSFAWAMRRAGAILRGMRPSSSSSSSSSSSRRRGALLRNLGDEFASRLSSIDNPRGRRALRLVSVLVCAILVVSSAMRRSGLSGESSSSLSGESSSITQQFSPPKLCTIVYVLGVEGSMHHGVTPVLRSLAKVQVDEDTGLPYDVKYAVRELRSAIFGFSKNDRTIDNPTMVRHTMRQICPANGVHHVIVEDLSFPSGDADDPRTYRVHRQRWWYQSTMEQIAMSETALNHPTNLYAFYEAYSPYADIRFVVLHRPYIQTVASHMDHDGTVEQHSNVLRGYMLLLRRFLDAHPHTWTLVCVERMTSSFHGDDVESRDESRRRILARLAGFLGWDHRADGCHDCYDGWKESGRDHVGELGEENLGVLLDHMRKLGGIWPPEVEDPISEQKCGL